MTLLDFTLSNARRFYSTNGEPLCSERVNNVKNYVPINPLRGSVPKNGPIDFASKNHFSLNSADGKGLIPKY